MKFAAIKGQMGIWKYYVTTLSFEEVSQFVSPITKEISNSASYSNLLQRAITSNVENIKDYLLIQPERMFNSIVLAVYDGNPEWYELDVNVEEYSTFSVGVLELSGKEVIFPVDGQHRVEGIKLALKQNSELKNEKVPVILIGHENSSEGKRRTRRLFSTLNRRARRVSDNEIIALDEDDVVAIATRELAEDYELFMGNRLVNYATKNIPSTNKIAFTSILTLYEVNKILFSEICKGKRMSKAKQEKFLLYRPEEKEVEDIVKGIRNFWCLLVDNVAVIKEYVLLSESEICEKNYRSIEGGNLLFRPIALSQFILAVFEYKKRKQVSYEQAFEQLGKIPMVIQEKPWKNILWLENINNINGRIRKKELMILMLFLADETILNKKEKDGLIEYILSLRDMDQSGYQDIIDGLRAFSVK